jgi:preprotein translocase subunit SecG
VSVPQNKNSFLISNKRDDFMLYGLLIVLQVLVSILLVVAILLQSSKGGGLAGIAGGLASSTVFGGRSAANFLTRTTSILATIFFLNCLGMAVMSANTGGQASVTQQAVQTGSAESPVPIPTSSGQPTENIQVTPEGGGNVTTTPITTQPSTQPTQTQPTQTQPNTGATETK